MSISRSRTLYVSPFFFPEQISTGKWNTQVACGLAKTEDITVFCMHPLYPEWKVQKSQAQLKDINIVRVGHWIKFPNSTMLRRVVLELFFAIRLLMYILPRRKKFDKIILVLPPSLMGIAITFIAKAKVIGIVHDLQTIYLETRKGLLSWLVSAATNFIESAVFHRCDKLLFLSNEMLNYAVKKYQLGRNNSHAIYPFVTINEFINNGVLSDKLNQEHYNIVYSGALGEKQNPEGLLQLLVRFTKENKDCRAHIFSRGQEFENLQKIIQIKGHVYFHDLVNEEYLPELLMRSDIQILPQASATSAGSLPSKIPNILASAAKLFVITDEGSEITKLLHGIEDTYVATSWDIEDNLKLLKDAKTDTVASWDNRLGLIQKLSLKKVLEYVT